jgi:hypothetical protein
MYPLVNVYIAIENCHIEIVDFPIKKMVIFNSYVNVYQRPKTPFSDTQMVGDAMVFNMGTE